MTDSKIKNVPALRFPGFTDAWEQRKLGEVFKYKQGQQVPVENQFENYAPNRHRFIRIVDITQKNEPIRYIDYNGENVIKNTDLFMIRYGQPGIVGYGYSGVIANNLFRLIPKINVETLFFYYIFETLYPKISSLSSSTTMPALSFKTLDVLSVKYPEIEEQQKIGSFFKQLDDTIDLHQRKLDLLKEQKKGFLQKMFPKNGEKVPELRFRGFTDDWEQRKFLDVVNRLNKTSNSSELPKLEFEDVIAGQGQLNKDISEKLDNRKGILFRPENILYGKLRPYLKNWFFPGFPGIALGDFWVFEARNSIPAFVYYLIQSSNYQKVANDTSGTKMPRSDWKKVSTTLFAIPNLEEQQKIGSLFKKLDDTIALHQRKIDLLKEQKKSFLQKMFV